MPYSLALSPVECWRGTSPSQAAKSRPLRKAAPLPMAATVAVETRGPTPGICREAPAACVFVGDALYLVVGIGDVHLEFLPLLLDPSQEGAHTWRFCPGGIRHG